MIEPDSVSNETLKLMSIVAAANGALAALGVAIASYAYFHLPHSDEIHYAGKYGEVVSSAAVYIFVFPAFQIWVLILSVIGRRGATRQHSLENFKLWKNWPQPSSKDLSCKVASIGLMGMELVVLIGTISRSVVLAYGLAP